MQIPTDIMVALIGLAGPAFGAFKLEEAQAVIQEQIKVANHRIGDLEKEREE